MTRKRRDKPTLLGELWNTAIALTILWAIVVASNFQGLFDSTAIKAPLIRMFGVKSLDSIQSIYWLITLLTIIVGLSIILLLFKQHNEQLLEFADMQTLEQIRSLAPDRFEVFVAELIRQRGYKAEVTPYQGDHGIDIIAYAPNGEKEVVQCKKYQGQVGEPALRDFYGAMMHEQAVRGWFVTSGVFTDQAAAWAEDKPIDLVDGERLLSIIRSSNMEDEISDTSVANGEPSTTDMDNDQPVCPKHGIPMVVRLARHGERRGKRFYGCPKYPACHEIINIDP